MAFESTDVSLPAQAAAGATIETVVAVIPSTFTEQNWNDALMTLTAPATVTGVATNNATFNFRQYRAGALVATPAGGVIGALTLAAGTNLPAFTETAVAVNAGTALQKGDVVTVQQVQNGTGLAIPANVFAKIEIS